MLESHAGGSTPEVAIQPQPPTPLPTYTSPSEQLEKKGKREKKGNKPFEEGEITSKDLEPQKGAKIAKRAERKYTPEGSIVKVVADRHPRVPIWTLKKHEIFLTLRRDLAMVRTSAHPLVIFFFYFYLENLTHFSLLHIVTLFLFLLFLGNPNDKHC